MQMPSERLILLGFSCYKDHSYTINIQVSDANQT